MFTYDMYILLIIYLIDCVLFSRLPLIHSKSQQLTKVIFTWGKSVLTRASKILFQRKTPR